MCGSLLACSGALAAPVGVAVAVVYDTSGSMRQPPAGATAKNREPKSRIAQRSFLKAIRRLETFAANPMSPPLSIGVYVFKGQNAIEAIPLRPFDGAALRQWLAQLHIPEAATPIGDALYYASRDLLVADAISRHILVLTDGANTAGRDPVTALEELTKDAARRQRPVSVHVIALDVNPRTFNGLQERGATLIGAANEAELNASFDRILEEKILVEAPR
jgi:Mg-chelatase subunit ChlD